MYVLVSLLVLVLFVGALVDIIMRDQSLVRYLPKLVWILIVILLPTVGAILWFALGRERTGPVNRPSQPRRDGYRATGKIAPPILTPGDYGVPGSFGPRNTEAELAALEREIVAHEKADHIRRLEAELRARRGIEGPTK